MLKSWLNDVAVILCDLVTTYVDTLTGKRKRQDNKCQNRGTKKMLGIKKKTTLKRSLNKHLIPVVLVSLNRLQLCKI